MFTRLAIGLVAAAALGACQPAIPDSGFPDPGRGVGFDDFGSAQAQRDAALASPLPSPQPVLAQPIDDGSAEATAAETARVLAATDPNQSALNSGVAPVVASPGNPAPAAVDTGGMSQEQNFDAVAAQRGIDGDAARIAQARAQYQVVRPEALPDRGASGPNIVAYALQNSHPVGTQVYQRIGLNKQSKYERACARYNRSSEAQIAFLEAGGPQRDRLGMDPDGDGYACRWDPAPFRAALQAG